jgi:hypothetical protein
MHILHWKRRGIIGIRYTLIQMRLTMTKTADQSVTDMRAALSLTIAVDTVMMAAINAQSEMENLQNSENATKVQISMATKASLYRTTEAFIVRF